VRYEDIKSKHDGVISALHLKTSGGFVSEGAALAEFNPEISAVIIRAQILPKDLAEIRIGQMATISLTSYGRA
jgi:multidrug resistance efflux pump